MNEEPRPFWRKPRPGLTRAFVWFVLLTGAASLAICCFALLRVEDTRFLESIEPVLVFSILLAALVFGVLFIRWVRCWRNFRRFLLGAACFATVAGLFYAEENWRGKWAWEKFKREWEAKGERFDRASVIPPPVPDDQNFALTPVVASSYNSMLDKNGHELQPRNTNIVDRLRMVPDHNKDSPPTGNWQQSIVSDLEAWQQYYRALAAKTNVFAVPPQPQSPPADVLLALSKYDPAIEELRQAGRLPFSRFPLEYDAENTAAILLPHLAALKGCSRVLQLRALAELQGGQNDKALADVKLSLRLTDSIRTEPILISHLVRIALVNLMLQPLWEGLAGHRWSDAQLVELDRELAGLDFLADYKLAMRGEMVLFQGGIIDYLRHHPEQLPYIGGPGEDGEVGSFTAVEVLSLCHLIPSGWFYQNQLRCARLMVQYFLPAADLNRRTISPSFIRNAEVELEVVRKHPRPNTILEALLLPGLGPPARKFALGQTSADLARVAIALERYRLAHGEYPVSLNTLAPQFIAKLPHDVIGGQPFKYRRTEDGQFMLYSVGWNETDDGGEVGLNASDKSLDNTKGDWVWRYPAK